MRRITTCAALIGVALAGTTSPALAGVKSISGKQFDTAHLAWNAVTGAQSGPSELTGMLRTANGALRVGWPSGGSLQQAVIAPDGHVAAAPPIVTGWVGVTSPAFVPAPGGALRVFFGGRHTATNADPNRDLNVATSTDGGTTWVVQPGSVTAGANGSDYAYTAPISAVAVGADLHPLEAWAGGAGLFVHAGLTPGTPNYQYPQAGVNQAAIAPRLASTGTGAVALAWVSQRPAGVMVQQVDSATGAPVGQPATFPDLVTPTGLNSQFGRTPLFGRSVLGGFFSAYRGGGAAGDAVRVWGVGRPHSSEFLPDRRGASGSDVAIDGDTLGHLWLGYTYNDHGTLRLSIQRSDATHASVALFGTRVIGNLPGGTTQVLDVEVSGQPDRLDVLVTAMVGGVYRTYATQVRPGLTLGADVSSAPSGPARTVTFRVSDAGVPVPHAKVSFLGHTVTTGHDGTATMRTSAKRSATATATRAGYVTATRRVRL